tara:strand:+ start:150 stop:521 length:372 start_codon:yes stop_codon:yes gene_type:complete
MPAKDASKFTTESINVTATAADGSAQLLYACPTNFSAVVTFLIISSGTVANKDISIQFYHQEKANYKYILRTHRMGSNDVFVVTSTSSLLLHQGDKLLCFTDSTGNFDVTVSVEEYFDPVRKL